MIKPLTDRQKEILRMIMEGNTSQQIADTLGLSIYTVSNHRKNIMHKTGSSNSMEMVVWGMRNNLLK